MINKRGAWSDLFVWMIIAFVLIIMFAYFMDIFGVIHTVFSGLGTVGGTNYTDIGESTVGAVANGMSYLPTLALVMILSLVGSVFITNALISKVHPVFFFLYVIVAIVAVIFSAYLSNAYETVMLSQGISPSLASFTAPTWIMLHLPIWTTIIAFVGGIFLFININQDSQEGGGFY